MIGKTLDNRYRVLSRLGEGGMGTVYLSEHILLGKKVAVKVLRPEYSRREELVQRFKQEAVAASRIGHDNIVQVTDFGTTAEGELYFVMEALSGKSLAAELRDHGALPATRSLPLLWQIASALEAAHGNGIIHRDLKPDNVMVVPRTDGTEQVKVLDFGISKVTENGAGSRITQVGTVMGTPEYMAPEQATTQNVDLRADVYSFGVLAYEVATGALPFEAETAFSLVMKHQNEPPPRPSKRRPDLAIPPALEALILRCLAKRREERFQSMSDVAEALSSVMASLGIGMARTTGPVPIVTAPAVQPPSTPRGGTLALPPEEVGLSPPPAPAVVPSGVARNPAAVTPDASAILAAIDGAEASPAGAHQSPPLEAAALPAIAPPAPVHPSPSRAELDEDVRRALRPSAARRTAMVLVPLLALAAGAAVVLRMRPLASAQQSAPRPAEARALSPPTVAAQPANSAPPAAPATAPSAPPSVPALPPARQVTLATTPAGATVTQNGQVLGTTPLTLTVRSDSAVEYGFALRGYHPETAQLGTSDVHLDMQLTADAPKPARHRGKAHGDELKNPYGRVDDLKDPY